MGTGPAWPANPPRQVRKNPNHGDAMKLHTILGPALVAAWLTGLHRLRRGGALRLRLHDLPALLDRRDVLVLDTETTGVGPAAEVIEVVAIDTTGALRLSALALPVGPISQPSRELHGLSEAALHAMGARPWAEVHPELLSTLRDAAAVLAWRADFDARVLAQTAALHHRALPPVSWADVRPAYVKARPGGRHSLAEAMRREGLEWEGRHHRAEADCRALLAVMHALANA